MSSYVESKLQELKQEIENEKTRVDVEIISITGAPPVLKPFNPKQITVDGNNIYFEGTEKNLTLYNILQVTVGFENNIKKYSLKSENMVANFSISR